MRLSDDDIDLIRDSFRELAREPRAAGMFYDRLFEIAPRLRPLFSGHVDLQGPKFMSMLGSIVSQLHDIAALLPLVHDLGRRHVSYGARPGDYGEVGAALIWTVARCVGPHFDAATEAAWQRAYQGLTDAMLEGAAA